MKITFDSNVKLLADTENGEDICVTLYNDPYDNQEVTMEKIMANAQKIFKTFNCETIEVRNADYDSHIYTIEKEDE